jgi:hypothetical protein
MNTPTDSNQPKPAAVAPLKGLTRTAETIAVRATMPDGTSIVLSINRDDLPERRKWLLSPAEFAASIGISMRDLTWCRENGYVPVMTFPSGEKIPHEQAEVALRRHCMAWDKKLPGEALEAYLDRCERGELSAPIKGSHAP